MRVITLLVGTVFAGTAVANTIHVCSTCAHTSIQTAVDDAASGDTINIAAGRYTENVRTAGKALTFVGESATSTFVYATGSGPVFTLGSGVTTDPAVLITIRGLTISHGNHTGGTGIGGGVQVRSGAYLHIENSTITGNTATSGGGIGVNSPGSPVTTISACLIDGNVGSTVRPGGPGGGVEVRPGSTVSIQQSIITRNTARNGGGVYGWEGSTISITGTTISGNFALPVSSPVGPSGGGGAGAETQGTIRVDSSYIVNNSASGEDGGGGLALYTDSVTTVSNTIIAQNSALVGGIVAYGGTLLLEKSYVVQNTGVGIFGNVLLSTSGSTIKDNVPDDICLSSNCPPP